MALFPQTLQTILDARGWAQKDACAAFQLSSATISQYLGGGRTPDRKQLRQILAALTDTERAALQIATMRDTIPDPAFRDLVLLTDATASARLREEAEESWRSIPLPEDVRRALDDLAQAAKTDPDVAALILIAATVVTKPFEPTAEKK